MTTDEVWSALAEIPDPEIPAISLVDPGRYTFEVVNAGTVPHALEIEGHGVDQKTATIAPGKSAKLTVDLTKAGSYEVYCPIDGHRKLGMEAVLRSGATAGAPTTGQTSTSSGGGY